jgi:hypothetical protein
VEAAGYFCVAELVRSTDVPLLVSLAVQAGRLSLLVSASDLLPELGRGQMTDRVEAAGGSVMSTTAAGRSVVKVSLPLTLS